MRLDRWLLDPLRLVCLLFGLQALAWYALMPEEPELAYANPRFWSPEAFARFLAIFASLVAGIAFGKTFRPRACGLGSTGRIASRARIRSMFLWSCALMLLVCLVVGALLAGLYHEPGRIEDVFNPHGINNVAKELQAEKPYGSLFLLDVWMVPAAILFQMLGTQGTLPVSRRVAAGLLCLLGLMLLAVSFFYMARTHLIHLLLIAVAASALYRRKRVRVRYAVLAVLAIAAVVALGALVRTGIAVADSFSVPLFDGAVLNTLWDEYVSLYAAGEFNSALMILTLDPDVPRQWAFASVFSRWFGVTEPSYHLNTINIVGIWWYAFGWLACGLALFVGAYLGLLYRCATASDDATDGAKTLYLVTYPGMYAMIRYNYWLQSAFLVPILTAIALQFVVTGPGIPVHAPPGRWRTAAALGRQPARRGGRRQ
jgi:hypothetical protein